jgi:hypothetical protein
MGLVTVASEGFNQDGVVVLRYKRTFMIYKKGHVPQNALNIPPTSTLPDAD